VEILFSIKICPRVGQGTIKVGILSGLGVCFDLYELALLAEPFGDIGKQCRVGLYGSRRETWVVYPPKRTPRLPNFRKNKDIKCYEAFWKIIKNVKAYL
jgi:hypothetical protein